MRMAWWNRILCMFLLHFFGFGGKYLHIKFEKSIWLRRNDVSFSFSSVWGQAFFIIHLDLPQSWSWENPRVLSFCCHHFEVSLGFPWFSKVTFLLTHRFACCVLLVRCFTIPMFPHIPTSLYTSFWPWINPTWAPYFDLLGHWELYNFQEHQSGTRNSRSSPQIPFNNSRLYPPNPHSPDFWHSKVIQCYITNDTRWWFQRLC